MNKQVKKTVAETNFEEKHGSTLKGVADTTIAKRRTRGKSAATLKAEREASRARIIGIVQNMTEVFQFLDLTEVQKHYQKDRLTEQVEDDSDDMSLEDFTSKYGKWIPAQV